MQRFAYSFAIQIYKFIYTCIRVYSRIFFCFVLPSAHSYPMCKRCRPGDWNELSLAYSAWCGCSDDDDDADDGYLPGLKVNASDYETI